MYGLTLSIVTALLLRVKICFSSGEGSECAKSGDDKGDATVSRNVPVTIKINKGTNDEEGIRGPLNVQFHFVCEGL